MHRTLVAILSFGILASSLAIGKTSYSCYMSVAETMSTCCCYPEENQKSNRLSGDHDTCKLPDCEGKESGVETGILTPMSCCSLSYEFVEVPPIIVKANQGSSPSSMMHSLHSVPVPAQTVGEGNGDTVTGRLLKDLPCPPTVPAYILTRALLC